MVSMPTGHVIRDDDGEYFSEDPTFGVESKPDPAASEPWFPIKPMSLEESRSLAEFVKEQLAAK